MSVTVLQDLDGEVEARVVAPNERKIRADFRIGAKFNQRTTAQKLERGVVGEVVCYPRVETVTEQLVRAVYRPANQGAPIENFFIGIGHGTPIF
jgi:hypothetical protein